MVDDCAMGTRSEYSRQASLALIGQRFQTLQIWMKVEKYVRIKQKVRQHQPLDKLLDLFIMLLAGGIGVVEVNTRVRPDRVVQRSFGRQQCAHQSTVSRMLDVCTTVTVDQMRQAIQEIYQEWGLGMRHDTSRGLLRLDVDMTGLPTDRQGEGIVKGYFAAHRARRGRQVGRVCVSDYDEIVIQRLYSGARQLERSLPELVEASESVLRLQSNPGQNTRENTLLCVDAGGGTDTDIDWMLSRGYRILTKVHAWWRAKQLSQSVATWQIDPKHPQRRVGWPTRPHEYNAPTRQLVLDYVDTQAKHHVAALVSNLTDDQLCVLLNIPPIADAASMAPWLMLHAYDTRGGGVEAQNRNDKQGLGLTHRHKRTMASQEMLLLLANLAHNFTIWMRNELAATNVRFTHYGLKRMIRDVFQIDGRVRFNDQALISYVKLNPDHALSPAVMAAFYSRYE